MVVDVTRPEAATPVATVPRPQIRIEGVAKSFSGRVVVDVDELVLGDRPIEGLIGPNGAGKTTLMRLIMHSTPLDRGRISLRPPDGREVVLSGLPPHRMAHHGVVKSNQVITDFDQLTILDSLLLSVTEARYERPHRILAEQSVYRRHEAEIRHYLDYFGFTDPMALALSAGEKKLLDIVRCLLLKPTFLLLDEPAAGLPEEVTEKVMGVVRELAAAGTSVVIVEHDLNVVWNLCDVVHFMAEGKVVLRGIRSPSASTARSSRATWARAMSEQARSLALEVQGLRSGYSGVTVLKGLDFSVGDEIFVVLGANGAGKTTLLATLARLIPVMAGTIRLQGEDVSHLPPFETAARGIGYVPQEKGTFPSLTVLENLDVGGMIGRRPREERIAEVLELFPTLKDLQRQAAGTLSGGESRMVACGRALMQDPTVLLLDEPTAGLSPLYVDLFFERILEIHRTKGVAIVLAEQNATKALQVADRVMVLSLGEAFAVVDAAEVTTQQLKEGYRI